MNVDRQRKSQRPCATLALRKGLNQLRLGEGLDKTVSRRVTGVARATDVKAPNQFRRGYGHTIEDIAFMVFPRTLTNNNGASCANVQPTIWLVVDMDQWSPNA